jgi:hypothetical protein
MASHLLITVLENHLTKHSIKKGPWQPDEDILLTRLVSSRSSPWPCWTKIAAKLPGRIGKQCRERWLNHLSPSINERPFSADEDAKIIDMVKMCGTKWSKISKEMPGRPPNRIKNQWYGALKHRVEQGLATDNISIRPSLKKRKRRQRGASAGAGPKKSKPKKPRRGKKYLAEQKRVADWIAAQKADAPVFDTKDFVKVSHENLQVEDELELVPGSGAKKKSWRYASVYRSKTCHDRVVIWFGQFEYEGMDASATYTLAMNDGRSSLDQAIFDGANGILKDCDGDLIPTRFGPDRLFKPSTYKRVGARGLEVQDDQDGKWRATTVYRSRKRDGHVVLYFGREGTDSAVGLYAGLGQGYRLDKVPQGALFTGENGELRDGYGQVIRARWTGPRPMLEAPRAGKRDGTRAAAAAAVAVWEQHQEVALALLDLNKPTRGIRAVSP